MIGYIKGRVLECSEGRVLVGVGDSGGFSQGVGYLISTPQRVEYQSLLPASVAEFFIYTHVREDALDLYGFMSSDEKEVFLTLLLVNGVGPKSALGILSAIQPKLLVEAILGGDQAYLTQIPGIGKKTAERIVLELRDKFKKKVDSGVWKFASHASTLASGVSVGLQQKGSSIYQDARAALVGLGYKENLVSELLDRVLAEFEVPPAKAEELIRSALRQLA